MFAKLLAVFVFVGLRAQARPFEAFPTESVIDKWFFVISRAKSFRFSKKKICQELGRVKNDQKMINS